MKTTLRRRHLGGDSEHATSNKAGAATGLTVARFVGYYGLLGAAAVSTLFLH
jgi:hypothetical protein